MPTTRRPGRASPAPAGARKRGRARPRHLLFSVPLLLSIAVACQPPSTPVLGGVAAGGFLDAIRLAVEDRDAGGAPAAPIDTVLIPQGSNRAAPSLEAAQELTARPHLIAVIGHASSPASLASSQVYNRHRVVQIAPTSTAPLYSEAGPYSFRMVPSDEHQGPFLAERLSSFLPEGGRLAVLFVNDDYGRGLREPFLDALDRSRFEVVLDLPHTEGDVEALDVAHHIDALVATRPDLVVWLGRVPGLAVLLPGIRKHLGEIPVLGSDGASRADLLTNRGPWWEGVHYVDFVDMDGNDELREFRRRFQDRFGADAGGAEVVTYDAARIILSAVSEGVRTSDELREYLLALGRDRPPFPGLAGPIRFDERGDAEPAYVLVRIGPLP